MKKPRPKNLMQLSLSAQNSMLISNTKKQLRKSPQKKVIIKKSFLCHIAFSLVFLEREKIVGALFLNFCFGFEICVKFCIFR